MHSCITCIFWVVWDLNTDGGAARSGHWFATMPSLDPVAMRHYRDASSSPWGKDRWDLSLGYFFEVDVEKRELL